MKAHTRLVLSKFSVYVATGSYNCFFPNFQNKSLLHIIRTHAYPVPAAVGRSRPAPGGSLRHRTHSGALSLCLRLWVALWVEGVCNFARGLRRASLVFGFLCLLVGSECLPHNPILSLIPNCRCYCYPFVFADARFTNSISALL